MIAMTLHTTEVTPLSNHRLFLRFNNGDAGEVDLSGDLDGEVFEPLRDPAQFATAYQHPVMRTSVKSYAMRLACMRCAPSIGNRFQARKNHIWRADRCRPRSARLGHRERRAARWLVSSRPPRRGWPDSHPLRAD